MRRRRRYRRNDGFDPIPWIVGGVVVFGAYELFQYLQTGSLTAATGPTFPNGANPATSVQPVPGQTTNTGAGIIVGGGGSSW